MKFWWWDVFIFADRLRERLAARLAPWAVYLEYLDDEVTDTLVSHGSGETYVTGTGQIINDVHAREACEGRHCVIHNPSEHSMSDFPTHFRDGGQYDIKPPHMERICPHGIGHPDPDDAAYQASVGQDVGVHGCDGCCMPVERRFAIFGHK